MDDFVVAPKTIEEHATVLGDVFRVLVDECLELRLDKYRFRLTEVEFLRYIVSENGITATDRGVEGITLYPVPHDAKGVHRFIGMCAYFRKFIEKFSVIAKPLYDLIKKDVPFKFEDEERRAFESLKEKLTEAPVLALYSPRDETELHCDASSIGFGAVLLQRKADEKLHPIMYFSRRTTEAESRYHSFEL